jgi:DNA-binding NarL/FixJ family response regulator
MTHEEPSAASEARDALHLLLATERPPVHAFFAGLRHPGRDIVVHRIEVSAAALDAAAGALAAAAAVVVDMGLDPPAAAALSSEVNRRRPDLPLVALVCCPGSVTPWTLRALLASGVTSMLDLQMTSEDVESVLRAIEHGGSVLHLHLHHAHRAFLREVLAGSEVRAESDIRLLGLVALGLPDREIGQRLHLSPHTVKHQIERLRDGLRLRNRTELAAWAGRHGFYDVAQLEAGSGARTGTNAASK